MRSSFDFSGCVALVTGGARGIGRAIAEALAVGGAEVHSFDWAAGDDHQSNVPLTAHQVDISDSDAVAAAVGSLPRPVTLLVNNAGITRDNLLLRMKPEEWQSVIDTNLTGLYRVIKPALRAMMKARWGRIINLSSVVARMGNPGQSNYVASKSGIEGFTRSLAQEVGSRGITVNAVAPGFIETDMTAALDANQVEMMSSRIPLGTLGQAADVANAVGFLASEKATYITGETLNVNGGLYMG